MGPVLNSGVVSEEDGSYSIERPGDIEPMLLGKALSTAEMYTDLVAEASSVSVTLAKEAASNHYPGTSGSMLAYIHPKHKHRVYAFVTKTVKRGPQKKNALYESAIQNFAAKGLTLVEENITKCIADLVLKDLVKEEGD